MASENVAAASAGSDFGAKKRIAVSALEPGLRATYSADPDSVVFFDFDVDEAAFSREGDAMLVHQDNGAVITLQGMFSAGGAFPDFELKDGYVISGQDFMSTLSPRLDIEESPLPKTPVLTVAEIDENPEQGRESDFETAAGPTAPPPAAQPPGGGVGEFRQDMGELIGSVDRLDLVAREFAWDSSIPIPERLDAIPVVMDISIRDPFGGGPGGPFASEAGLARGTGVSEQRFTGWHSMTLPEGVRVSDVPEGGSAVFSGTYGELVIFHEGGSVYRYAYELQSRYQHRQDRGQDEIAVDGDLITFGITNGQAYGSARIAIDIGDDKPVVFVNPGNGPDGPGSPTYSGYDITGSWKHDFGADGELPGGGKWLSFLDESGAKAEVAFRLNEPVEVMVGGKNYGTIEFKSGGQYVFKTMGNQEGKITVVMGVMDRDNDFVQDKNGAGVTFDIKRPEKVFDPLGDRGEWFSEQHLPEGTEADSGKTTRDIIIPEDHFINTDLDGWEFQGFHEYWKGERVNADVYVKSHPNPQSGKGYLTYYLTDDGEQKLVFTLEKPLTHKQQGVSRDDPAYATVGKVTLEDAVGNLYEVDTRFTVYDDQPVLSITGRGDANSGYEYKGSWSVHYGADGPAQGDSRLELDVRINVGGEIHSVKGPISMGKAFAVEADGRHFGDITFRDGAYSFLPAPNLTAEIVFRLTGRDADGDRVSSEFTLKVAPADDPNLPNHLGGDQLYEANLVAGPQTPHNGTDPDEEALTQVIDIPAGYAISTAGWTNAGEGVWTLAGKYGFLACSTEDGRQKLVYTLTSAPQVAGEGHNIVQDSIDIVLRDRGGNFVELPVLVEIADDVPLLSVIGDDSASIGGDIFDFTCNGEINVDFGADGDGGQNLIQVRIRYSFNREDGSPEVGSVDLQLPRDGGQVAFETGMGKGVISFDAAEDKLVYSYEALRGKKGEAEQLSFSAMDGDGDYGSADMLLTLENDVPAAIFRVDEAGLSLGSKAAGHGSAATSETLPSDEMPEQAASVLWDTANMPALKADANDDGKYADVVWRQEGDNLLGYAENQLVAEIRPVFRDGLFTGEMTAKIHAAFDHKDAGDELRLLLGLTLENGGGDSRKTSVALVIKDDEPFGNTGPANSLDKDKTFEVDESGGRREDLYLIVDVSTSIKAEDMEKQIEALRFLVELYVESGVDVSISLVAFGRDTATQFNGASAEEFLSTLTADAAGISFLKKGVNDGTNYTAALEEAMRLIHESYSHPEQQFMDKKAFFLSDGAQTHMVNKFLHSWKPFYEAHPDLEIFALGVGEQFSDESGASFKSLENVAGVGGHVTGVDNFDELADALSGLVTPELGNMLEGVRSADHTIILSIYIGGDIDRTFELVPDPKDSSALPNTGKIDLGDGIFLVVYQNGDYQLTTLQNVESDQVYKVRLSVQDADNDVYETGLMNFTVKDYLPEAHDKLANAVSGFSRVETMGIFTTDFDYFDQGNWVFSNSFPRLSSDVEQNAAEFPYDPILLPYSVRGCVVLKADRGAMSPDNVASFIGDKATLPDLLQAEGILPSGVVAGVGSSLSVSLMANEFSSKGGEIYFNWSFSGINYAGEEDAAFWLLLGPDGSVVRSGKLSDSLSQAPGVQHISGVQRVIIDATDAEQSYKLVIGSVDGGAVNNQYASLMINTVVMMDEPYHFSGNLLLDPSPEGKTDLLLDNAAITHVVYKEKSYEFNNEGVLSIEAAGGLFVLHKNGGYTFTVKEGTVLQEDQRFVYHLKDQDADEETGRGLASGSLTVKAASGRAFTALAEDEHGFDQARLLGGFECTDKTAALSDNGWYMTHPSQFASGEAQLPNSLPVPSDADLAPYLGAPYPWVRMHGKDVFTPKQCFTLFDTNDPDEIREALIEAGVAPELFERSSLPLAGAAMQKSFISKGGEIAFAWSFAEGGKGDAAFWMLKDKSGAVVDSGLISPGGKDNGVLRIALPNSAQAEEYSLALGALKTGGPEDMEPVLYVGNVVLNESEYHFKGNILGGGENALAYYEGARLESVSFGDETFHFDVLNQKHAFDTQSGMLVIDWKGNYTYRANDPDSSIEGERFSYRVLGEDGDKSGELVVRMTDPLVHDALAEYCQGQDHHFAGNVFSQPSPMGEYSDVSPSTQVCRVEYQGKVYEMNEEEALVIATASGGELVIHRDGAYFFTDGPGSDGSSAVEDFYYTVSDARGHTDSAMLAIRGPQCQVGGNIDDSPYPDLSYGAQDYVDVGFGDDPLVQAHSSVESQGFGQEAAPLLTEAGTHSPTADAQAEGVFVADNLDAVPPLDIFDENGQFKWTPDADKGLLWTAEHGDAGKLHYSSLVEAGENMENLLGKQLQNINLDMDSSTLSFEIAEDLLVKSVVIQLSPGNDVEYADLVASYLDAGSESAQQEVLAQFLMSLSVH